MLYTAGRDQSHVRGAEIADRSCPASGSPMRYSLGLRNRSRVTLPKLLESAGHNRRQAHARTCEAGTANVRIYTSLG